MKKLDDLKRISKSTLCLWDDGVDLDMMHFDDEEKLGALRFRQMRFTVYGKL